MTMIIYIILFVLLAALTIKSFGQFSNNIFCFGAPILGFAIMVLNFFQLKTGLRFPIIFGVVLVVVILLWISVAKERMETLASCGRKNMILGVTKKLVGFAFGYASEKKNNETLFNIGRNVESNPSRFYADEPSIAIGGKIFNAVYSVSVLVFTIIIAIGNR